jgi:phenylalanyl-tRNA synthetase alpha chain
MQDRLESLASKAREEISRAQDASGLEALRVRYLGKKGELSAVLGGMGKLAPDERRRVGEIANRVKAEVEGLLGEAQRRIARAALEAELQGPPIDVTLPGRMRRPGRRHVVSRTMEEITRTFQRLGFDVVQSPEVELDLYNFEALNFPGDHPARDMQDTFYVHGDYLQHDPGAIVLRTHTSPGQIRTMLTQKPPIRVVVPGKVYRADSDATHTPMFHQIEGLLVDRKVTMAELKGTLDAFVHAYFGADRRTRFRPSFFPFTEPSGELDVSCGACAGKGCRLCKQTGWLEILGCGMVHQNVFRSVGYPEGSVTGFAFGMGIERVAMLRYGLDDLRSLFENDVRLLEQF